MVLCRLVAHNKRESDKTNYGKSITYKKQNQSQRASIQKIHGHNVDYGEEECQEPISQIGVGYFLDCSQSSSHHARYGFCFFQYLWAQQYKHGLSGLCAFGQHRFWPYENCDRNIAPVHGQQL